MDNSVLLAFGFTLMAGLSTGIGSALAFFADRTNTRFLAASLGFSAGVMIYVSFVELLAGATADLIEALGSQSSGQWAATIAFFIGMGLIAIIDKLVPEVENPHEARSIEDMRVSDPEGVFEQINEAIVDELKQPDPAGSYRSSSSTSVAAASARSAASGSSANAASARTGKGQTRQLMRMGTMTALVIGIHNFPEGLATFMSTIQDTSIGFSIAIAIAIHNIPEGIAVSVPIYYATGNKKKAFIWSFLSGLTEPLGALVGYLVLRSFMTPTVSGMVLAGVAGIMVYISLDELLPSAEKYGEHHLSIYGAVAGMMVMAVSLLLLT